MRPRILVAVLALGLLPACNASTDRALYGAEDFGTTTFNNGSSDPVVVSCTVKIDRVEDGLWVEKEERRLDACQLFIRPIPFPFPDPIFVPLEPITNHPNNVQLITPVQVDAVELPSLPLVPLAADPNDGLGASGDLTIFVHPVEFPPRLEEIRVAPDSSIRSGFIAPEEPGEYRIRYEVGYGCPDPTADPDRVVTLDGGDTLPECPFREPVKTPPFGVEEFCAVEECPVEAPVCLDPGEFPSRFVFDRRPVTADGIPPATFNDQLLSIRPQPGTIGFLPPGDVVTRPLPGGPVIFPFPVPVAECRRALDTGECRWVCDDATPIPPPRPY